MPPLSTPRPRPSLKRRTAWLVLSAGLIVMAGGLLSLGAAVFMARQLRFWGFGANAILTPGIVLLAIGAGLLVWWRLGTRRR